MLKCLLYHREQLIVSFLALAICTGGCGNGSCIAPNTCQCKAGWTGSKCYSGKSQFNLIHLVNVMVRYLAVNIFSIRYIFNLLASGSNRISATVTQTV